MPSIPWMLTILRFSAALSGAIVAARAIFGPIRVVVPINSPINAETVFAMSVVLAFIAGARRGVSGGGAAPGIAIPPLAWAAFFAGTGAWVWGCWFPFVAEDYFHIETALHSTLHSVGAYWWTLFTQPPVDRFFRPLGLGAYTVEAALWGKSRIAWHGVSLLLHVANSALVYAVARRRGHRAWPSVAASMFFLVCGMRPEAVNWISAQFDLWATLFVLSALLTFDRYRQSEQRRWLWVTLALMVPGLLSKESAYVLPLIVVLMLWIDGWRVKEIARLCWPVFAVAVVMFGYRAIVLQGIGGYTRPGTDSPLFYSVNLLQTGKALLRLPALFLFPVNWSEPLEFWLIAALIVGLLAMVVLTSARASARELCFGLGFLALAVIPAHPLLLIGSDLEKSRVLYLPGAGFALGLAGLLGALQPRVAAFAGCAILLFQVAALEHNLMIWRDVARKVESTCQSVAGIAGSGSEVMLLTDVPRTVDGVYFLENGFHSCIEWAAGKPLPNLYVESESRGMALPPAHRYRWDSKTQGFDFGR